MDDMGFYNKFIFFSNSYQTIHIARSIVRKNTQGLQNKSALEDKKDLNKIIQKELDNNIIYPKFKNNRKKIENTQCLQNKSALEKPISKLLNYSNEKWTNTELIKFDKSTNTNTIIKKIMKTKKVSFHDNNPNATLSNRLKNGY